MLLATTSISRASATWRDSPTRPAFCIGILPCSSSQVMPSRGLPCRKRARQALPSRRLVKSLQPPCQVIKLRKISLLVENCEVAGGAKTAVLAALPGKRFRPRGPQKASGNHTDLPSSARGARGVAHPRCLARDTLFSPVCCDRGHHGCQGET